MTEWTECCKASAHAFMSDTLGRPLGYLIFSLMALIRDPDTIFFQKVLGASGSFCRQGLPRRSWETPTRPSSELARFNSTKMVSNLLTHWGNIGVILG